MAIKATVRRDKESAVISFGGRRTIPAHYEADLDVGLGDCPVGSEVLQGISGVMHLSICVFGRAEQSRSQVLKQLKQAAGRLAEQLLDFSEDRL